MNKINEFIISSLEDGKAGDVVTVNVESRGFSDSVVVCTASSKRHALALMERVCLFCKQNNFSAIGVEGVPWGEWILIDFGTVIVHIMLNDVRSFYNLEELYS